VENRGTDTDIRYLKGVGERRAALYAKLGVFTVGDLLEHYPRDYIDLSSPRAAADTAEGELCAVKAEVVSRSGEQRIRRGLSVFKVMAVDSEGGEIKITFFNAKYTVDALEIGREYIFYGKTSRTLLGAAMSAPLVFSAEETGLVPQYPPTAGMSSRVISSHMRAALEAVGDGIPETLPPELAARYALCSRADAIRQVHFPRDQAELSAARRRIIFEELMTFALGMQQTRNRNREADGIPMPQPDMAPFLSSLGFELTGAQSRAIAQCAADMAVPVPMNRLVQGDVGSGKTAVAAACMYIAWKNGCQSAMMAPTEVLAAQHLQTLERMFSGLGVRVALLTGSMTAKQKLAVKESLLTGETDIVVGTHALIQGDVAFLSLGLIITDEQHRFGVRQRLALTKKGRSPHALIMSATPIPRTLAFAMYGDLDVSVIDEMPKDRLPIKTYVIDPSKRERAMGFVRKYADEGFQSYIVCPLVEQEEDSLPGLAAAADYADELTDGLLRGYSVGLLHGKMKPAGKERGMRAFSEGRIQILVSTTVIEVGVDVPNAVVMLVENAERFGLSQLHQLRGRVGRGKEQSYCILVSGSRAPDTMERLRILTDTNDGFQIAEQDLRLRGPGDFFGYRQHGLPMLKMADMLTDMKLLELSRECAALILSTDPKLEKPEHAELRRAIDSMLLAACS